MAMFELYATRAIRDQIQKACRNQGIELDQHMIENMVNQRLGEMAQDVALGTSSAVNWNARVKEAYQILEEARAQKQALHLEYKLEK